MDSRSSYLETLDQLLLDQPDDCMLLTQLDGFLTGVLVSPEMITPGRWLKHVWGGNDGEGAPDFEDMAAFQRFIDLVMLHYNQILASLGQPGAFEPVLETDTRNGDVLWEMWIDGFGKAMDLAPIAWLHIAANGDASCTAALTGIRTLRAIANGAKKLSRNEEECWDSKAPDLIPIWVETLHAKRLENEPGKQSILPHGKVGRNDPCRCGSGKKHKKCCGLN